MPLTGQDGSIPLSDLADFALGHLSPEQSLEMLDRIEKDPGASSDLEFVIRLLNLSKQLPPELDSDRTTR